jgi:hypothetical protein
MKASIQFFHSLISSIIIVFFITVSGYGKTISSQHFSSDSLKIRVYLEGPLFDNGNALAMDGRPLMRDNLRSLPLNGQTLIPGKSPYTSIPFYAGNANRYGTVGTQYDLITDSTSVFSIQGQDAIVDWVFIEIRNQNNSGHVLATRSALLQRDGDVVDIDGTSPVYFPGLTATQAYVVVKHRNHLGVMSNVVNLNSLIDFTSGSLSVFDYGTSINPSYNFNGLAQNSNVKPGFRTMWAGDFDSNGKLKFGNPGDDMNQLLFGLLYYGSNAGLSTNFDSAYGYLPMDYDLNGKVKFDNPGDDKNMLFSQIIFYPLNGQLLENFGLIIEQVPTVTLR